MGGGSKHYAESIPIYSYLNLRFNATLPIPTRGCGYWCWKPQIILQSLSQLNDGDILIYADIGCEFAPQARENLLKKLEILNKHDLVGFHLKGFMEKSWSKGDIFTHFGVRGNKKFEDSYQIKSGVIFMKKSPKTLQLINEWLEIYYKHFSLIDDSPSNTPNYPEFVENRHDQSIFSMLMKKHNCFTFEDYWTSDGSNIEFGIVDSRKKETIDSKLTIINLFKYIILYAPFRYLKQRYHKMKILFCNSCK